MSLPILVAEEKWQDFDDAWNQLLSNGGPIDELLHALRLVGEKKRMPRCMPLAREHAQSLKEAGRPADAARLLGMVVSGGGSPSELGDTLYQFALEAWGGESTWAKYSEVCGFGPDAPQLRRAWESFERLMSFAAGTLVFHPGGWGTGEVLEVDPDAMELQVRFQGGRSDRFPMSTALDVFENLPEGDLRAMAFRDAKALKKKLKDEPLEILRAVVERHNGRATTIAVKNALMQVGVEGGSWSAWWRKVRKLAENSEWFKVTGTPQRGEVRLLLSAKDPVQNAQERLEGANLELTLKQVRDGWSGKVDERLGEALLALLEERIEEDVEAEPAVRLSAWMLLRDRRKQTPEGLRERLDLALEEPLPSDPTEPPALWKLFNELSTARDQEGCIELLKELFGEGWYAEASLHMQHAPVGMIRPLLDTFMQQEHLEDLARVYTQLLSRPLRSPDVLVGLAKLAETGKLKGDFPSPVQRAQSLLSLATYLHVNRKNEPRLNRSYTRLSELLATGREPLLEKMLESADYATLASLKRSLQRGVEESIDNLVTDLVMTAMPESEAREGSFFWDSEAIWTTRAGLARRQAELKQLVEVKIPENTEALGRAAAMGDLSENYEWTAAIEEQRNLADRSAQLERELKLAELIEEAILPEDTVSPGTWVRYREQDGSENRIEILGPWDTHESDSAVSYRAPLAWGLLGKRTGERATVRLPAGEIEVEVLEVGPVQLEQAT